MKKIKDNPTVLQTEWFELDKFYSVYFASVKGNLLACVVSIKKEEDSPEMRKVEEEYRLLDLNDMIKEYEEKSA